MDRFGFKVLYRITQSICLLAITVAASNLFAQTQPPQPPFLGIAHVAFFESDFSRARTFYKDFLGFGELLALKRPDGTDWLVSIKVNDLQYLELFAGTARNSGHLSHFALYTNDATTMRAYLISRGVEMVDQLHKGQTGDRFFTIKDPDGHFIEIVEYQPDSWTGRGKGKFMPAERVSSHISHVGILVAELGPAMNFYRNILGLQEIGRNSEDEKQLRWIDMRVPGGSDYVELILDSAAPSPGQHKAQNHVSLVTDNLQKTAADLQSRTEAGPYDRSIQLQPGTSQKQQLNVFDPDGARIEITGPPGSQ